MSEPTTVTMAHHISAVCIVSHPFTGRKGFITLDFQIMAATIFKTEG